jgi:hypothetical protein
MLMLRQAGLGLHQSPAGMRESSLPEYDFSASAMVK